MPREEFDKARLAAHHLGKLTAFQQFVLVAQGHGLSTAAIASASRYGLRSVQEAARRVGGQIAHPLGYDHSPVLTGTWLASRRVLPRRGLGTV